MNIIDKMKIRLKEAFFPTHLMIRDDSHQHIGHAGALSGGGHYVLEISAKTFNNKTRVMSHQLIYQALGDLMGKDIHALQIKIL